MFVPSAAALPQRIPVVWVNRKSEPARGGAPPDREVRNLEELAERFAETSA